MRRERVHNEFEGIVLIKEAFKKGTEDKYDGTKFYTHEGDYLFKVEIRTTEFEVIYPTNNSVTIEL